MVVQEDVLLRRFGRVLEIQVLQEGVGDDEEIGVDEDRLAASGREILRRHLDDMVGHLGVADVEKCREPFDVQGGVRLRSDEHHKIVGLRGDREVGSVVVGGPELEIPRHCTHLAQR